MIKFINKRTESVTETTINDETYVQTELGTSDKYPKVLEVNWDTNNDTLVIELVSASTDDPLGLICTFILPSKVFFQKLCKDKIDNIKSIYVI